MPKSAVKAMYFHFCFGILFKELNLIGKEIEEKLKIGAPRLVRHCKSTDAIKSYYDREFELWLSDASGNFTAGTITAFILPKNK